jgi:hypothetical protein
VAPLLDHGNGRDVEGVAGRVLEGADAPLAEDDLAVAPGQDVLGGEQPLFDGGGEAALEKDRLSDLAEPTAANLMERVLPPESRLRQWVLTFPFSWRRRLSQDGALLGRLTRITVETVLAFYADRAAQEGGLGAKSGVVTAVQRTSSDLRLNEQS